MKVRTILFILTIGLAHYTAADWRDDMRIRFIVDRLYGSSNMLVTLGQLYDGMDSQQKRISVEEAMEEHAELTNAYVTKINVCVDLIDDEIEAYNCCVAVDNEMRKNVRNITSMLMKSDCYR